MAGVGVMDIVNSALNTADTVLPYLLEPGRERRQQKRQMQLMDVQQQHQMQLDAIGQKIQLDTWEKTNYPAQVEQMKKAGLNPALLYGKGGGGGATTGSQGGGSAASGNAGYAPYMPMDLGSALMTAAQIKLINAEAKKAETEANVLGTTGVKEAETRIDKMIAETNDIKTRQMLTEIQSDIARIDQANRQYVIDAELNNIAASTRKLITEGKLTQDNANNIIAETAARAIGQTLQNELTQTKTTLTKTEIDAITTNLTQKWAEISQKGRELDQKDQEILINTFKAEMEAEYPGVGDVLGGIAKKAYKSLKALENSIRGTDTDIKDIVK